MLEHEPTFDRQKPQIHLLNRIEDPFIIIPGRIPKSQDLVVVKNLDHLPPPHDAVAMENRADYMEVSLSDIPVIYPLLAHLTPKKNARRSTETDNTTESQDTFISYTTESGLLVVTDFDLNDPKDETPTLRRQMQRLEQYEHMTDRVDVCEKILDSNIPEDEKELMRLQLCLFKELAESMYRDELSQEAFTKDIADGKNQSRLPQNEQVTSEAEEYIKHVNLHLPYVMAEVDRTLRLNHTRDHLPELANRVAAKKRSAQEMDPDFQAKKSEDDEKRMQTMAEKLQEIGKAKQIQKSGVLYVHDPVLDEPSEEAAAFVNELFSRPF